MTPTTHKGAFAARSPWSWIPTLYVAEGLPYFAVNVLTVLMYTNLGASIADMAFYTGWLYLPWVIKPFWSPFVDVIRTKRWWVLAMQGAMAVTMAMVAFTLPFGLLFSLTLAIFWLMAFCSATHDIAADGFYMLALNPKEQAAYVGVRSTFYRIASVVGQGGLVILAGWLETTTGNIPLAWEITFGVLAAFFFLIFIWHTVSLPNPSDDTSKDDRPSAWSILKGYGNSFVTFFRKRHVATAILFMLFYRFPEAMCIKVVQPFLLADPGKGGLGLTTSQVGFANGTIGVIALLAGGILGGLAIARKGLRFWLWPMAGALTLPCILYCFLAMWQPASYPLICTAIGVEQFGYGFGFTAFMMYLIYFSQGTDQTSHYAFCTGFMALGMMIPGMFAGEIYEWMGGWNLFGLEGPTGFINFFWWVMASCLFTLVACALIKIPKEP